MSFKGNTFDSPKFRHLLPNLHVGRDGWITSNNSFFAAQVVRCVYPVSEQYCRFPRYLYYTLAVIAVLLRKNAWIAPTIMGSVMAYSGVASVHALAMAGYDRHISYPAVAGADDPGLHAASNWVTLDSELRLPVFPQAWDDDGDAVLAVVGVAYVILAGMQTYSSTFRQSESKTVLFLWSLLLLIGMISAFVHWAHVDASAFPQFRFCPISTFNDTLPITRSRFDIVSDGPWNDTIWNAFETSNYSSSSQAGPALCIYPCFSSSLAFRSESEINVLPISTIGRMGYNKFAIIVNLVYTLMASSGLCSLTIFLIKIAYWNGNHELREKLGDLTRLRPFFALSTIFKLGRVLWSIYIFFNDLYARFGSLVALLGFVCWVEWMIWYDPQASDVQSIGEWGTVVAAGLVMLAAVVAEYSPKVDSAFRARMIDGDECKNVKICAFVDSNLRNFSHFRNHSKEPRRRDSQAADDLGRSPSLPVLRASSFPDTTFKDDINGGGSDRPPDALVSPVPVVADVEPEPKDREFGEEAGAEPVQEGELSGIEKTF